MPTQVTALFADRLSAHAALEQLVQAGFTRDAISIAISEGTYAREFGGAPAARWGRRPIRLSGILGGIASAMVKLPPAAGGFVLYAVGPLTTGIRRVLAGHGVRALETALEAVGLARNEARFVGGGLRCGFIAVCVIANENRARLATQLLELSGGESLQAA
jgi:hypothetical protein